MKSVPEALECIDRLVAPIAETTSAVDAALGAVVSSPVGARTHLPPFAQSAMDGYAVRAEDVSEATPDDPVELTVVGEVAAGGRANSRVEAGEAVQIFTGAPVPDGADAVIRREKVDRKDDDVVITGPVASGRDVRPVGEELAEGTRLVDPGTRLDEGAVAMLSMAGVADVEVRPIPDIRLFVSGDEVVAPGVDRGEADVYDANTPFLESWFRRRLGADVETATLPDDPEATRRALDRARDSADLVVSTGGVSMGDYDYLVEAADELGDGEGFWKVAQKPGKPVRFTTLGDTPFLGLPGNPGAVFVSTYVYVERAVERLQGVASPGPRFRGGRLAESLEPSARRWQWVGCRVDDEGATVDLMPVDGHRLGQLYDVDGLIGLEPGEETLEAGEKVRWLSVGGGS